MVKETPDISLHLSGLAAIIGLKYSTAWGLINRCLFCIILKKYYAYPRLFGLNGTGATVDAG